MKENVKMFRNMIEEAVAAKKYIRVQYFSDIHEFLTVVSVAKAIEKDYGVDHLILASGPSIPIGKIVRVDDKVSPDYNDIMDFTCDC